MAVRVVIVTSAARQENPIYIRPLVKPGSILICADGGTEVALGLGLRPDLVVGDLDSLDETTRREAEAICAIRTFPVRKDKTDTHLALEAALDYSPDEVMVCGAFGDRFDHNLGLVALTAGLGPHPRVVLKGARQEAFLVRGREALPVTPGAPGRGVSAGATEPAPIAAAEGVGAATISGAARDVVSLIPLTPTVSGVSTEGLGYPLREATLRWGETLGVSNEMLGPRASVTVDGAGLLLVVHLEGAW